MINHIYYNVIQVYNNNPNVLSFAYCLIIKQQKQPNDNHNNNNNVNTKHNKEIILCFKSFNVMLPNVCYISIYKILLNNFLRTQNNF